MVHKLENVSSVNDTFFAKRLVQNIPRVIELDTYGFLFLGKAIYEYKSATNENVEWSLVPLDMNAKCPRGKRVTWSRTQIGFYFSHDAGIGLKNRVAYDTRVTMRNWDSSKAVK